MIIIHLSARHCLRLKNLDLRRITPSYSYGGYRQNNFPTPACTENDVRCYFTNTDQMKKSDPFAQLGLEWGATASEIKDAYRRLARELHPDVSQLEPSVALNQFRLVKEAYDKLMNNKNAGMHRTDLWEEWSFAIWRNGDTIAQERTDVAGSMRKRPVKPADSIKGKWGVASLGHPDGRGASVRRGEYLSSGERKTQRSATVGTGNSKWVQKKEFQPWNPKEGTMKGVSQYRKNDSLSFQTSGEKTK